MDLWKWTSEQASNADIALKGAALYSEDSNLGIVKISVESF